MSKALNVNATLSWMIWFLNVWAQRKNNSPNVQCMYRLEFFKNRACKWNQRMLNFKVILLYSADKWKSPQWGRSLCPITFKLDSNTMDYDSAKCAKLKNCTDAAKVHEAKWIRFISYSEPCKCLARKVSSFFITWQIDKHDKKSLNSLHSHLQTWETLDRSLERDQWSCVIKTWQ